jgi:nicotinamide mononucleotide (NMN) deamidase PncC
MGTVTYATRSKIDLLDVDPEVIEKYSVVSEQVWQWRWSAKFHATTAM